MAESTTKKIAQNFTWLLIGNVVSGIIAFFCSIYIARVIGAGAFGLYSFSQAFLLYLLLVVDSGLSILGTKEVAAESERVAEIVFNILSLRFVIAVFLFLISSIAVLVFPINPRLRLLFIGTFIFVFCRALNLDWAFQGLEKMKYIAISKVSFTVIVFILVLLIVHSSCDLVKIPFISAFCGLIVSIVFIWLFFKENEGPIAKLFDLPSWSRYFLQALPLGISAIMIQIYGNIDTIMLGFIEKPAVVGYYNAAYKIYGVLVGLYVTWQATALPIMSVRMRHNFNGALIFLKNYTKLTLLVVVPISFIVFLISPLIIDVIFGQNYMEAAPVLRILIWMLLSVSIGSCYTTMWLIPAGKFNYFLGASGVGAASNILLNYLLIPRYSMYGAAVASLIAEVMAMIVSFFLAQSVHRLNLFPFFSLPLILSTISTLLSLLIFKIVRLLPSIVQIGFIGSCFLGFYLFFAVLFERRFISRFVRELIDKR